MTGKSIIVSKETYDQLKIMAAINDKFLYELIDECITILKDKYKKEGNPHE